MPLQSADQDEIIYGGVEVHGDTYACNTCSFERSKTDRVAGQKKHSPIVMA